MESFRAKKTGTKAAAAASSSMMNQTCEIEATGINYKIYTPKRTNPFKIWSKEEEEVVEKHPSIEQVERGQALPRTEHRRSTRQVLKNVSCRARPWEILAIVGPSGAGKSTLLEILAGKITPQMSTIYVNKKPIDKARFKKISGYVTQKDTLFPLLTVEETLMFSAKLRLKLPPYDLASRVDSLIQELGLGHVARARIGDDKNRGISGGERRRVSIGVDVIHDPRVLILDEPTSGLDSTSALQIIDMLKIMADTRGRTIILSIHQPGFRIVKLFNSILLLANGAVLHHGTVDQLQMQMRSMDLSLPLHVNVVEFAIDAIETLQQHRKGTGDDGGDGKRDKFTLQQLFQLNKMSENNDQVNGSFNDVDGHDVLHNYNHGFANSRLRETAILSHRFSKNIYRTKELFACRTIQMLASGLVLGSIFYNLDDDRMGAEGRVGLFAFILTFLLSCTTEALPIFLQERDILMKETSCGSYRVSSYVIANGLVFLPFLLILSLLFSGPLYWLVGLNRDLASVSYFLLLILLILYTANSVVVCFSALAPNFIVGNSLISGVMGAFFLFSGYFISRSGIPSYWIFMHYISLFKYPFEGFLVNEFSTGSEKCLEYKGEFCLLNGEDLLREEGLEDEGRWRNVVIMVCFILAYRFFSYVILRCRCSQRTLSSG